MDREERRLRAEVSLELAERLLGEARVARAQHAVEEALNLLEGDDSESAREWYTEAHLLASETNLYRDRLDAAESHAVEAQGAASAIPRGEGPRLYSEAQISVSGWAAEGPPELNDAALRTRSALAYWKVREFQGHLAEARANVRELASACEADPQQASLATTAWHRALACSVKLGDMQGCDEDGGASLRAFAKAPIASDATFWRWHAIWAINAGELALARHLVESNAIDTFGDRTQLERIKSHFPLAQLAAAEGHYSTAAEILAGVLPWTIHLGAHRFARLASEAYLR